MAESDSVSSLPRFDTRGDTTTIATRWRRWKRGFANNVLSRGVTQDARKLALLLHTGGLEFQDLYYSLVGDTVQTYQECLQTLDGHFVAEPHTSFERHLFRGLQQAEGETISQFVCRLRQQAQTCNFDKPDEMLRDQIIERCNDPQLKRKFLEKTGNVELKDLLEIAKIHEAVEMQLKSMTVSGNVNNSADQSSEPSVNVIKQRQKPSKETSAHNSQGQGRCYRCNELGHYAKDPQCKAKKKHL